MDGQPHPKVASAVTSPDRDAPSATRTPQGRSRGRRIAFRVVATLGGIALLAGIATTITAGIRSGQHNVSDLRGNAVQLDPGVVPIPAASSQAKADTGARLIVKSVGLNVPLGALNAVHGEITPPGFTSAYWVRNEGVSTAASSKGTVFVVMHSLRGRGMAPGNYLADVAHQRSKVPGDATVSVAGVDYVVTGSQLISKGTLSQNAAVWANTPNRLLLITCLEHADGSASTDNLVITATRTG
jgi:hypothetical protein